MSTSGRPDTVTGGDRTQTTSGPTSPPGTIGPAERLERPEHPPTESYAPDVASTRSAASDASPEADGGRTLSASADFFETSLLAERCEPTPNLDPPTPSASPSPARPPRFLGDYEVLGEIARGGMGVVYRARQVKLNRLVALKVIRDGRLAGPSDLRRFRTDAEALARLEHPHIVPIYEVGQVDDQPFFSMKLIEGNLLGHIDRLKSDPRSAAVLMAKIAQAVNYAHQRAILHRDIKSSNILVDEEGEPYLTDLGLAKRLDVGSDPYTPTRTDAVMGTPSYMAPEQARGEAKSLTTAVDVYGLGATLYETLTGRPPFQGATPGEILHKVLEEEPTRPHALNPLIDPDLEAICLKCLEKRPGDRYSSAERLADDLDHWREGRPTVARPVPVWGRALKWARRRPVITALSGLLIAALLTLVGVGFGFVVYLQRSNAALRRQTELAQQSAYISDLSLVRRSIDDGEIAAALTGLEKFLPRPGDATDRRGFEWFHLRRLCDYQWLGRWDAGAPVQAIAHSPDGRLVATGHGDVRHDRFGEGPGQIILWEAATGQMLRQFEAHGGPVLSLAFRPGDGGLLASSGADRLVRLWDPATGAKRGEWGGFRDAVHGVAFALDGRSLAAVAGFRFPGSGFGPGYERPGEVAGFDLATGREVWRHDEPNGALLALAYVPAPTRLITVGFMGLQYRDPATGRTARSLPGLGGPRLSVLSTAVPVGGKVTTRLLLSGTTRSTWAGSLADGDSGATLVDFDRREWHLGGQAISDLAFAPPHGDVLAFAYGWLPPFVGFHLQRSTSRVRAVRIWDARANFLLLLTAHQAAARCLAYSPDGRRLLTADDAGVIHIWETTDGRPVAATRDYPAAVTAVAVAADDAIVVGLADGAVRLDAPGASTDWLGKAGSPVTRVAIRDDGRLLASAHQDGLIRLWDRATGSARGELKGHSGVVQALAFRPGGDDLASAGDDGIVRIWDPATLRARTVIQGHEGAVFALAYRPGGEELATAGGDGAVRVWNAANGQPRRAWRAETTVISALAYSPDGRSLATAGFEPESHVRLWDAATGATDRDLGPQSKGILGLAFSAAGATRLATAGADGAIRLWDPRTGLEVIAWTGDRSPVVALAFRPDGRRLVAASRQSTRAWSAEPSPFVSRQLEIEPNRAQVRKSATDDPSSPRR